MVKGFFAGILIFGIEAGCGQVALIEANVDSGSSCENPNCGTDAGAPDDARVNDAQVRDVRALDAPAPDAGQCQTTADCPPSGGGACARVCGDGSNPCVTSCVAGQCGVRGCPEDVPIDAGASECSPPCVMGDVCVRKQVVGGVYIRVDDAGACPSGTYFVGNHCERNPTLTCEPTPLNCDGALPCVCVLCGSFSCQSITTDNQVNCLLEVP